MFSALWESLKRTWLRIIIWAVVLGIVTTLLRDWGQWSVFPVNLAWRILIVAIGGLCGVLLNYYAGFFVTMGTNVIESMGTFRFTSGRQDKIENGFVGVCAIAAAILAWWFIP
jgi:predicted PurR-regulated permease PerM